MSIKFFTTKYQHDGYAVIEKTSGSNSISPFVEIIHQTYTDKGKAIVAAKELADSQNFHYVSENTSIIASVSLGLDSHLPVEVKPDGTWVGVGTAQVNNFESMLEASKVAEKEQLPLIVSTDDCSTIISNLDTFAALKANPMSMLSFDLQKNLLRIINNKWYSLARRIRDLAKIVKRDRFDENSCISCLPKITAYTNLCLFTPLNQRGLLELSQKISLAVEGLIEYSKTNDFSVDRSRIINHSILILKGALLRVNEKLSIDISTEPMQEKIDSMKHLAMELSNKITDMTR